MLNQANRNLLNDEGVIMHNLRKPLLLSLIATTLLASCSKNDNDDPEVPQNTRPVAYDQSITTVTDTPVTETLSAEDPDNDSLTYHLVGSPANGNVEVTTEGNFTYTPNAEFTGNDTVSFRVFDGVDYSPYAAVSITVARKQEQFSSYSRTTYQKMETDIPTGVNGRDFNQDVISTDDYQDLVDNGEQ